MKKLIFILEMFSYIEKGVFWFSVTLQQHNISGVRLFYLRMDELKGYCQRICIVRSYKAFWSQFNHYLLYNLLVWWNLKWICYYVTRNLCQNSILRDAKMHNQKCNMWELVSSEKKSKEIHRVKWVKDTHVKQTHCRYML